MRKRQSLDTIEALFDQVETFIDETLREDSKNSSTHTFFPDVTITNEHVIVPIYGVNVFSQKHKKQFKTQFPQTKVPKLDDAILYIKLTRINMTDNTESPAGSLKRLRNKK